MGFVKNKPSGGLDLTQQDFVHTDDAPAYGSLTDEVNITDSGYLWHVSGNLSAPAGSSYNYTLVITVDAVEVLNQTVARCVMDAAGDLGTNNSFSITFPPIRFETSLKIQVQTSTGVTQSYFYSIHSTDK